jgi:Lectin C-type domain
MAESMTHEGMPGHLVTLTSPEESEFLSFISRFTQYWIGGYQDKTAPDYSEPSGGWRWVTGEPFLYTNWDGPEPNQWQALEDYIMTWTDWRWNDNYNGSNVWGFAVEFEPVSELLGGLISRIEGWSLKKGTAQSLIVKLRQAREKLKEGDTKTAMNILSAFGSEVQAQKGKHLTSAQADQLIHQTSRFLDVLSLLP